MSVKSWWSEFSVASRGSTLPSAGASFLLVSLWLICLGLKHREVQMEDYVVALVAWVLSVGVSMLMVAFLPRSVFLLLFGSTIVSATWTAARPVDAAGDAAPSSETTPVAVLGFERIFEHFDASREDDAGHRVLIGIFLACIAVESGVAALIMDKRREREAAEFRRLSDGLQHTRGPTREDFVRRLIRLSEDADDRAKSSKRFTGLWSYTVTCAETGYTHGGDCTIQASEGGISITGLRKYRKSSGEREDCEPPIPWNGDHVAIFGGAGDHGILFDYRIRDGGQECMGICSLRARSVNGRTQLGGSFAYFNPNMRRESDRGGQGRGAGTVLICGHINLERRPA